MDNSAGIIRCSNCSRPLQATNLAKPGWSVCKGCDTPDLKKERLRVLTHLRRAYSVGLPATLTLAEWLHTLQDFNGLCAYCQQRPFEALEHFIPLDAGGSTTVQNCVPSCERCNTTKGTKNPDSQQLDLFINENRERVRRYLAGRTQSSSINVDLLADFDDPQGMDFSP